MEVTLSGITIEVKLLQLEKAYFPIVVTPLGITIDVNAEHLLNNLSAIVIILFESTIETNLLQPANACPNPGHAVRNNH